MSVGVVLSIVIAMVLLFISMVLSALSASEIQKKEYENGRKYAMWSAVSCGLSIAVLVVALIIYVHRQNIINATYGALGRAHETMGAYANRGTAAM